MRITEPTDVSASLSLSASLAEWSWLHGGCCLSSSGHKYRRPLRRWRWRWGGGGGSPLILSLMVVGSYPPWMDGLACPLLPEALGGLVQLVRVVGELFLKALAHMFLFVGQSFLSCNNKKMC